MAAPEPAPRRILKRTEPTEPTEGRQRQRPPMNPHVIVEYECGACAARNVVTREVRFLQTFVVRDNVNNAFDSPAAALPGQYKFTRTQADTDAEREVEDILNCKDTGADDCEFQVNITNAVAAAAATTTTK